MAGYWEQGRFVAALTMGTATTGGVSGLDLEIAAAMARAREGGSALTELKRLLQTYPLLKREAAEGQEHPLRSLAALVAEEKLGTGFARPQG
jgi:hypothetical protein